jgi:hypothetical protein
VVVGLLPLCDPESNAGNAIILDPGTRWRRVISFKPRPLYPGERAHGIQLIEGWVDCRINLDAMEKRKFLPLPGIAPEPSSPSL